MVSTIVNIFFIILCTLAYSTESIVVAAPVSTDPLTSYDSIPLSINDDIEILRTRIKADLIAKGSPDQNQVQSLLDELAPQGYWPSINYDDVSKTGFEHSVHLSNMLSLALAYQNVKSVWYQNPLTKKSIESSLNYWLENDFICDNWWWNQIGTPDRLVDLLLIMDNTLSRQYFERAAPIVGRAHLDAWGARPGGDRIKIASILGKVALCYRDEAIFKEVVRTFNEEVHFAYHRGTPNDKRGLQTDFSFHHRKDRVTSTLSYGLGYAKAFGKWAEVLANTEYQMADTAVHLLVDFFLDGINKTTAFGRIPDIGAKNRSLSRKGTLTAYNSDLPRQLLIASQYRNDELKNVVVSREGKDASFAFNRFFWHTEYMSHQQPNYFTSIRMYSSRNHSMEVPYNGEGLRNHHLGDGANYIIRTGNEYLDIFPVWDWQKIPGTTVAQKPMQPTSTSIQQRGLTDFVGGVSNGIYGVAAFDFMSPLDSLSARKAWFMFDKEYVCLGSGITLEKDLEVVTTLNQTHLKGSVIVVQQEKGLIASAEEKPYDNVDLVYHDSVAYMFFESQQVYITSDSAKGNWRMINTQHDSSPKEISYPVFKSWISHGWSPDDDSYAYMVAPAISYENALKKAKNFNVEILANTESLQAVKHKNLNMVQSVFYDPDSIKINGHVTLITNNPSIFLIQTHNNAVTSISLSEPTRSLEELSFMLTGKFKSDYANTVISYNKNTDVTSFKVALPKGEYAGQSITMNLNKL